MANMIQAAKDSINNILQAAYLKAVEKGELPAGATLLNIDTGVTEKISKISTVSIYDCSVMKPLNGQLSHLVICIANICFIQYKSIILPHMLHSLWHTGFYFLSCNIF